MMALSSSQPSLSLINRFSAFSDISKNQLSSQDLKTIESGNSLSTISLKIDQSSLQNQSKSTLEPHKVLSSRDKQLLSKTDQICHSSHQISKLVLILVSVEEQLEFMIAINTLENSLSIVALNKSNAKKHQKTTLLYHANQSHQRRTQNFLNSSRKNLVEEEYHLKNNSLTTTEKF